MTYRECAIVQAFTGAVMLTGDKLKYYYIYVHEILNEPVSTYDFLYRADEIKEKSREDFIKLCEEATE